MQYSIFKKLLVAFVVLLGVAFAMPNIISSPSFLPQQQVKLGLDLQGGAHLLLEVDENTVFEDFYTGLGDSLKVSYRQNRISYKDVKATQDRLTVVVRKPADFDKAYDIARKLSRDVKVLTNGMRISFVLTEKAKETRIIGVVTQTIEIVRRRIDSTGTQEPLIQRQGIKRIVVQLPGIDNPDAIKKLLGKTAKMTFHLVDSKADTIKASQGIVAPGRIALYDEQGRIYVLEKRVYLSGENLVDAQASYSQNNAPVVSFRFDSVGARKFGRLTSKARGRQLAIVLDGKVISAPNINEPILGGSGIITGSFTIEEVNELAVLLRAGALPAPLTIVEERTVGPGLGADSIQAGKIASMLGLVFVMLFMMIIYRRFGVYANVALVVNMILVVAVLSALQATLTLPGIAGIVLTIGMAVDANVLIFERIREEIRNGEKMYDAVTRGFDMAYITIIDANITSLIAGLLLYAFGTGPIKGFAVTLSIGIVSSMFSAILITRWLLIRWVHRKKITKSPLA